MILAGVEKEMVCRVHVKLWHRNKKAIKGKKRPACIVDDMSNGGTFVKKQ